MQKTHLFDSISSARQILENLKKKLSPFTSLPLKSSQDQQENQPNLANVKSFKVSDQMEILWLKSTIDELCKDNAILYQDVNELLRVIEYMGIRYKGLKEFDKENILYIHNNEMIRLKCDIVNEKVYFQYMQEISLISNLYKEEYKHSIEKGYYRNEG